MNKNPFLPPPPSTAYSQPPLPPGPPPAQPPTHDYTNYWAPQQSQPAPYPSQWNSPQPSRPPADQNHLYANYGYGPHWQRQQQPQQTAAPYQPPPGPAPPQPPYNPYQPTAGYGQVYPPSIPPPYVAPPPQPPTGPVQQQYFPQTPPAPPSQPSRLHHSPPQNLPPAKRQRFEGPTQSRQPQFPTHQSGPPHGNRSGAGNVSSRNAGNLRGGMNGNRAGGGNSHGGGGPRPGGSVPNKSGLSNKNSRNNSSFSGSNRGGAPNTGLRGHNSRNNMNGNTRRSGGSFTNNGMGGGSFRHRQPKGARHDGTLGGGVTFGSRSGPMNSSHGSLGGRRDENRRTLTDFKLLALEVPELDWFWGIRLSDARASANASSSDSTSSGAIVDKVKTEPEDVPSANGGPGAEEQTSSSTELVSADPKAVTRHDSQTLPSRMRIYFHTPVSADDSRLPIHSLSDVTADTRKGKRKKIEDDDGDLEEGRAPRPPPGHSDDRSSVAASVAPSASSEPDWLMDNLVADTVAPEDGENETRVIGREAGDETQLPESTGDNRPPGEPSPQKHDIPAEEREESHIQESVSHPLSEAAVNPREDNVADGASGQATEVETPQVSSLWDSPAATSGETTLVDIVPPQEGTENDAEEDTLVDKSQPEETQDLDESQSVKTEPASPTISHCELPTYGPILPDRKTLRTPSANRLSVSYAGGNKRLIIDSETVNGVKIFRQEGRIEITMTIAKDKDESIEGILVELISLSKSYSSVQPLTKAMIESDPSLPPFTKVSSYPSQLVLVVHLDIIRPLSEPKWVKSGDIVDWLKSLFGRMFWVSGEAAQGWEKKITVVDPDPPPSIGNVLEGWAINSPVGGKADRERFLKTHMTEMDNIIEILLRLVRGERTNPFSTSLQLANLSGPLLAALTPDSAHGSQQTHVSLAVLATFRMAVEFAKAKGEKGVKEAEENMGEIIRCLPSHLVYKSLDGIFKEWRAEKRGGR